MQHDEPEKPIGLRVVIQDFWEYSHCTRWARVQHEEWQRKQEEAERRSQEEMSTRWIQLIKTDPAHMAALEEEEEERVEEEEDVWVRGLLDDNPKPEHKVEYQRCFWCGY
jgi:hypothetical protein